MSGYQRFVAYVYEYQKNKKGDNCGFIKVEVRDGRCTMEIHLHCAGLSQGDECKIYGFVRKDGLMNGILLGCTKTKENKVECLIETSAEQIGEMEIPLEKLNGMILQTKSGVFFGTAWDEEVIRPDNFREIRKDEKETEMVEESKEQGEQIPEVQQEESVENEVTETESFRSREEECIEDDEEEETEDNLLRTAEYQPPRPVPDGRPPMPPRPVPDGRPPMPPHPIPDQRPPQCGSSSCPFEDMDTVECRRIRPQELARYLGHPCPLVNNSFLQHGYYHFGHILLCRMADGRLALGVPGVYSKQENFAAGIHGFPYFRESPYIHSSQGRGGYWYRMLK